MIKIVEDARETPLCPHCEKAVDTLLARKVKSVFGVRYLYYCPSCRKVLGLSHRKGFWMG